MDLAEKLKIALDESRLLILGAQVVFGCQFQMVFQEGFQGAPRDSQAVHGIGLLALMLAVALLITPSMTHQIAYRGEDRRGALRVASRCAGLAGVPMTLGLGATTFVVFESLFNRNMGVVAGVTFAAVAFSFLYALGLVLRIGHTGQMPPS
jgi:TRAP-type C4-dicarboxylate transport system permease small subunit